MSSSRISAYDGPPPDGELLLCGDSRGEPAPRLDHCVSAETVQEEQVAEASSRALLLAQRAACPPGDRN